MVAQLTNRQRRVADFVAPLLRPGESVEIVVPDADERPSWWIAILAIVSLNVVHGRRNALVVTNQRLLVVPYTWDDEWPKKVRWDWPLRSVRVLVYSPGTPHGYLCIGIPGGPSLTVTIDDLYESEVDELVSVLESTTHSAPHDSE